MGGRTMAESEFINTVTVNHVSDSAVIGVGFSNPNIWTLDCDIAIEDVDAEIRETSISDISFSAIVVNEDITVDTRAEVNDVIDLSIGFSVNGITTSGPSSQQAVPYDRIIEITEDSPEAQNESQYSSSAWAVKQIYDDVRNIVAGGGDKNYYHSQNSASSVWTIRHGLGKRPSVTVIDSAGTQVYGEVEYIDSDTVKITFKAAFSGYASLN